MFLLKSDDEFTLKSISHLFNQREYYYTLDKNKKYFFIVKIKKLEKELQIKSLKKISTLKIPVPFNVLSAALSKLLHDHSIEVGSIKFYPYRQSLHYKDRNINLGNIHFIIFSQLILSHPDTIEKEDLYKNIWPKDKDYQMNKLDTHLTNLKNYLDEKIDLKLNFSSISRKIKLIIN
jgi:DNA-binding response OmpR family regulator